MRKSEFGDKKLNFVLILIFDLIISSSVSPDYDSLWENLSYEC